MDFALDLAADNEEIVHHVHQEFRRKIEQGSQDAVAFVSSDDPKCQQFDSIRS